MPYLPPYPYYMKFISYNRWLSLTNWSMIFHSMIFLEEKNKIWGRNNLYSYLIACYSCLLNVNQTSLQSFHDGRFPVFVQRQNLVLSWEDWSLRLCFFREAEFCVWMLVIQRQQEFSSLASWCQPFQMRG